MSKILFVASEVHPLIKTGGLADVAGALPPALKQLHNTVRIILPAYQDILESGIKTKSLSQLYIPGTPGKVELLEALLPQSRVKIILVQYEPAYGRHGNPYMAPDGSPWEDNAERFTLLCRVATAVALDQADLNWQPDIVHCNDWQSGLVPALLSMHPSRPGTVFTIHNIAYQGLYPRQTFVSLGLDEQFWQPHGLEFHNQLSFIKGGLVYADQITTVSPRYAEEIQTHEFGYGLEGLLKHRKDSLSGIVNGIDQSVWDPQQDSLIEHYYKSDELKPKTLNKRALQEIYGLPTDEKKFLLGFIGRLVDQKGIDLICEIAPKLLVYPIQLVILGSGQAQYESQLQQLAEKFPHAMGVRIGYDESLAHKIEAGADAFLMPSRFEPCGLNQLYSLRYGTVPIVNNVGGLHDTVCDKTSSGKTKTGFVFDNSGATGLLKTIIEALDVFRQPQQWQTIMRSAMKQNYSWEASAKQYHLLYKQIIKARKLQTATGKPRASTSKIG